MHTMAIPALPYIIALEKGGEGGFEAHNEASDTMWQFVLSGANTLGRSKCFAPAATFPIPFSNHQSSHRSGNTGKGIASGKKQSQLSNNPPTILEISIKYRFILCFNWMPRRSPTAAPRPDVAESNWKSIWYAFIWGLCAQQGLFVGGEDNRGLVTLRWG